MQGIKGQLLLHLNRIDNWADNNGFKFYQSKTVYNNLNPIPVKRETKFLGILLDSKLTFVPHIKAFNLLIVVSNTYWVENGTVLLQLYRALVHSKLDYNGC